jgi:hypothetical protein
MSYRIAFDTLDEHREVLTNLHYGTMKPIFSGITALIVDQIKKHGEYEFKDLVQKGKVSLHVEKTP